MKISDKEEEALLSGRIKAIISAEKPKYKEGDMIRVGEEIFRVTLIKKWSVARIAAQRSNIDFNRRSVSSFRALYSYIYGSYYKDKDKIVWLIGLRKEKKQKSIGDW